jgi:hypothetical protein
MSKAFGVRVQVQPLRGFAPCTRVQAARALREGSE